MPVKASVTATFFVPPPFFTESVSAFPGLPRDESVSRPFAWKLPMYSVSSHLVASSGLGC